MIKRISGLRRRHDRSCRYVGETSLETRNSKLEIRNSRREFLQTAGLAGLGLWLARCGGNSDLRPHLYVTLTKTGDLRSLDEVREAIGYGHAADLWGRILSTARNDLNEPLLTPASLISGRSPVMAEQKNPDFVICEAAGQRILRAALVHLISGEEGHREMALRQIEALFDDDLWPQWLDQAHERFGLPAGLRTGMLAKDVGLAFDWLYTSLSSSEKRGIVDGLDRKAIQPFFESAEKDAWWLRDQNNWLTTIAGGLGIAGMALRGHHPRAQKLIDMTLPLMEAYLGIYGEAGEFNESVAYANATERPVNYFGAYRYATGGGENRLAQAPFPETCRWLMYLTLPPGRSAAFGDGHPEARPWIDYIAAVAAASRDGMLQWYYHKHAKDSADPLQFLWYDASVAPVEPHGRLPLGRVFPAHGGCIVSRADWNQGTTPCVVYGKFGREENHEHNDIGQLCIDGYGERLIVDLGSPSSYPSDFFDENRWHYYNASALGHNVFTFGDREMRVPARERGEKAGRDLATYSGRLLASEFDDARGGYWQLDLTNAYVGAVSVKRTVVHLLPGIVAVLDEAELDSDQAISMRWHTRKAVETDELGRFAFESGPARLAGLVARLDGEMKLLGAHHRYEPPYHLGRAGDPLEQRHEPYLEAFMVDRRCRLLSLFSVSPKAGRFSSWEPSGGGWEVATAEGIVQVSLSDALRVERLNDGIAWQI